jgi:hypothetical protein
LRLTALHLTTLPLTALHLTALHLTTLHGLPARCTLPHFAALHVVALRIFV